ncbi:MAG: response regulator, partial [Nitrospinota bacterium]
MGGDIRVLIIDDDKRVAEILSMFLDKEGCVTEVCVSGEEAIKVIEKRGFDIVFLDLRLGDMNGMEILSSIGEKHPCSNVVVITGNADIKTTIESMKLGAVDYIVKPFGTNEIGSVLSRIRKDIRLRRELDEKTHDLISLKEYNENIIDAIPSSILVLKNDLYIVSANRSFFDLLKKTPSEIERTHVKEVLPVKGLLKILSGIEKRSLPIRNIELTYSPSSSRKMVLNITITSVLLPKGERDGKGLLLIIDDITEKRALEQEVEKTKEWSILGKLFPIVAHEVRNPLHAIGGAVALLKNRYKKKDEVINKLTSIIIEEIERLNRFVKDCLEFSRPVNRSNFDRVDINEVIRSCIKLMESVLIENNIRISLNLQEGLPILSISFDRIRQVFINIVDNAVAAMTEGGRLEIKTSLLKDSRNFIEIRFSDTGVGIKKRDIDSIFNPFFTTKTGGIGLGLAITKKIVTDDHKGDIKIISKKGKGTTTIVTLP